MFQTIKRYKSKFYKRTIIQQIQDTQDNKEYLSYSRETIGSQESRMMLRDMFKNVSNANKIKYST